MYRIKVLKNIASYEYLKNKIFNIDKRYKIIFLSVFIWGFISHGMTLFNKFSFHDDMVSLFGVGGTYTSGRWMLGIISTLVQLLYDGVHYSLPLFNGVVSFILLGLSLCIAVNILDIKSRLACVVISGLWVTFPSVAGLFGFMFTAHYYSLALFMAVSAAYLICKYKEWYTFVAAVIIMGCSMGIYQAYIPFFMTILLAYFIKTTYLEEEFLLKKFVQKTLYYILSVVASVLVYFGANKFFLWYYKIELSEYADSYGIGKSSFMDYIFRIVSSYREFFIHRWNDSLNMYSRTLAGVYYIITAILIFYVAVMIFNTARSGKIIKSIVLLILNVVFPISVNFMYVLSDSIHPLMVHSVVLTFLYLFWLMFNVKIEFAKVLNMVQCAGIIFVIFLSVAYCRFDNVMYMKVQFEQTRVMNYCNTLITQVKSVKGYSDKLPVVFINLENNKDLSVSDIPEFEPVDIHPYHGMKSLLNDYSLPYFIERWNGYKPTYLKEDDFINLPEVIHMPSYPNEGSIKIVNDTVVVKF